MPRYTVAVAGCGNRGSAHTEAFAANADRFDLVGCCDLDRSRAQSVADRYGVRAVYDDAASMLESTRPQVLCFATLPEVRLPLIKLGLKYGVNAIAFEKPIAAELEEAREIYNLCKAAGIKFIISHQQKYGPHWQAAKKLVESGEIGEVTNIHATTRAWLGQQGTHIMDYMIWFNGGNRVKWVLGQAVGTRMLVDSHPSADFVFGTMEFENGVRGVIESGAHSPHFNPGNHNMPHIKFWTDISVTVHGTLGYARVVTGNGWQALTKSSGGKVLTGEGDFNPTYEQPLYIRDLADWLDGKIPTHPCNEDVSYHGFEAVMGLFLSALDHRKVELPMAALPDGSLVERMRNELPPSDQYAGQ